jgi:hypothetical protein
MFFEELCGLCGHHQRGLIHQISSLTFRGRQCGPFMLSVEISGSSWPGAEPRQ